MSRVISNNRVWVSSLAMCAAAGLLSSACGGGDDGLPGGTTSARCGRIDARITALQESAADLQVMADGVRLELVTACANVAGMDVPTEVTEADVSTICNAATAAIDAEVNAGLRVTIVPPSCQVDAQAQLECESSCYASAEVECDPGSIEARCDPGELSVVCEGTCDVGAKCEGSLDVAVACEGSCEGTCEGTCTGACEGTCSAMNGNGECEGTCEGTCGGTCSGQCRGSCTIESEGGISCGAQARCTGGCTGEFSAPSCEASLEPPECSGSAEVDCSADCQGQADFNATCDPGGVTIVGGANAEFNARLEASLPQILVVAEQAGLSVTAAGRLATEMPGLAVDAGSCALELGANVASTFSAAATAAVEASASASASATVSVDVTASATASAG